MSQRLLGKKNCLAPILSFPTNEQHRFQEILRKYGPNVRACASDHILQSIPIIPPAIGLLCISWPHELLLHLFWSVFRSISIYGRGARIRIPTWPGSRGPAYVGVKEGGTYWKSVFHTVTPEAFLSPRIWFMVLSIVVPSSSASF